MGRVVLAVVLIGAIAGGFFFLRNEDISLKSPVPKVFGISKSPVINKWFPKNESSGSYSLSLSAKSAILVDYDTGEIVFERNLQERLPVASTVKIMTGLLALENSSSSDIFEVSGK